MCVGVCVHMYAHVFRGQRTISAVVLQALYILFFKTGSLIGLELLSSLNCLPREHQGSPQHWDYKYTPLDLDFIANEFIWHQIQLAPYACTTNTLLTGPSPQLSLTHTVDCSGSFLTWLSSTCVDDQCPGLQAGFVWWLAGCSDTEHLKSKQRFVITEETNSGLTVVQTVREELVVLIREWRRSNRGEMGFLPRLPRSRETCLHSIETKHLLKLVHFHIPEKHMDLYSAFHFKIVCFLTLYFAG